SVTCRLHVGCLILVPYYWTHSTLTPPLFIFFLRSPPPPRRTLFPYTTLFRSSLSNTPSPRVSGRPSAETEVAWRSSITPRMPPIDRKSTRLNSSHVSISYAVFCLKKKNRRRSWYRECQHCGKRWKLRECEGGC